MGASMQHKWGADQTYLQQRPAHMCQVGSHSAGTTVPRCCSHQPKHVCVPPPPPHLCCTLECEAAGGLLLLSHDGVGLGCWGKVHSQSRAGSRQGCHQASQGCCRELLGQLLCQLLALHVWRTGVWGVADKQSEWGCMWQ